MSESAYWQSRALAQAMDLSNMLDAAGVPETEDMTLTDRVQWALDHRGNQLVAERDRLRKNVGIVVRIAKHLRTERDELIGHLNEFSAAGMERAAERDRLRARVAWLRRAYRQIHLHRYLYLGLLRVCGAECEQMHPVVEAAKRLAEWVGEDEIPAAELERFAEVVAALNEPEATT